MTVGKQCRTTHPHDHLKPLTCFLPRLFLVAHFFFWPLAPAGPSRTRGTPLLGWTWVSLGGAARLGLSAVGGGSSAGPECRRGRQLGSAWVPSVRQLGWLWVLSGEAARLGLGGCFPEETARLGLSAIGGGSSAGLECRGGGARLGLSAVGEGSSAGFGCFPVRQLGWVWVLSGEATRLGLGAVGGGSSTGFGRLHAYAAAGPQQYMHVLSVSGES